SIGVGPRPIFRASMPLARRPHTTAASISGLDSRPSYPTATFVPPARATTVPKQRPMAKASSAFNVRPTMPRMSYSRSDVGSNEWVKAIGQLTPSHVGLQEGAHGIGQIGALQGEGDLSFQEAYLVAAVKSPPLVAEAMERLDADQPGHPIGELHLVAGTALHACEVGNDLGHQHVAADDRQVG